MKTLWTLIIKEVSPGCFKCEAIRQDHWSISKDIFENGIPEFLQEVFQFEIAAGTRSHEAAFHLIRAMKRSWHTSFSSGDHGSWSVRSQGSNCSINYDGNLEELRVRQDGKTLWSGFPENLNSDPEFFRQLILI